MGGVDPHFYINLYIFHGVFEILSTFLGCPSQNVENGQRPPTQNVEVGRLSLVVLVRKSDFWKVLGLARNPSKRMRLDESFRMVPVSCHWEVVVKSYGQITEMILWPNFRQNM